MSNREIAFWAMALLTVGTGIVFIFIAAAKNKKRFYLTAVVHIMVFFLFTYTWVPDKYIIQEERQENKVSVQTEPPTEQTELATEPEETVVDGWSGDVSDGAQMVLRQIAEDMAKKIAQNPSTVKMSLFSAGYAKNGHLYAVQQEFSCSNLMGVSETHIVKVVCESNADESKIQPFEVWLDGNLVYSQERKYAE